jgi:hypothetical protein
MVDRTRLLNALTTMPDEAFGWFVLATSASAHLAGANTQIWPDGIGGFTQASKDAITEIRAAAEAWRTETWRQMEERTRGDDH